MDSFRSLVMSAAILFGCMSVASAVPTVYHDEALYLSDLASMGYVTAPEGFEDHNFWGLLEPTATTTVPDVTSRGVTWTGLGGGVDLLHPVARTGDWALKSSPEGSPFDGFLGVAEEPMYGFGGWVRAGNTGAGAANDVSLFLNGSTVAEDVTSFNSTYQFIGVIDPAGISSFQFETEPVTLPEPGSGDPIDPSKTVFLDDFTFGFGAAPSLREPGIQWSNPAGGTYAVGANWTGGSAPAPADNAIFHLGSAAPYTVNFTQNQAASQAVIANDKVAFDLGGFQYDLTEANITRESLIVGERPGDVGELTVTHGTLSGVNAVVAHSTASTGHLTIDAGAAVNLSGAVRVGSGGTGTLDITHGGTLISAAGNFIGQLGGDGTVNIDGAGSAWNLSGFGNDITLGSGGATGTLSITGGGTVTSGVVVTGKLWGSGLASDTAGSGAINVAGAGSTLDTGAITLALDGGGATSTMNITDGAQVTTTGTGTIAASADADVVLDGAGSSWTLSHPVSFIRGTLRVGEGDQNGSFATFPPPPLHTGTLTIRNGATVTAEESFIGGTRTGRGVLTVTGAGSSWTSGSQFSGNTFIGYLGDGELNVLSGATIQTGQAFVGRFGLRDQLKGVANIDGPGSAWNTPSTIWVGFNNDPQVFTGAGLFLAEGDLNVTNGGTVNAFQLALADRQTSKGVVNISGPGSVVTVSNAHLGSTSTNGYTFTFGSNAELNISDAGLLDIAGNLDIYHGDVNLDQGTINATEVIIHGTRLTAGSNASDTTGDTRAALTGTGQVNAGVDNRGGRVVPGGAGVAGVLNIDGDYMQHANTGVNEHNAALAVEIGGFTPGIDLDQLAVTGTTTLDGTLALSILDTPFAPAFGDSFDILNSSSVVGVFSDVTGTLVGADTRFAVSYLADRVRVEVVDSGPNMPGDLNDDGFVGLADLNLILGRWNHASAAGVWPLGDVSGDGFIGIEDLNAVLGNWNAGTPPPAEALASVPEPSLIGLLGAGVLWHVGRGRA